MKCTENSSHRRGSVARLIFIPVLFAALFAAAQSGGASGLSILPGESILPRELAMMLQSKTHKPTVLYVGPRFLYAQAHVPGAEFIGPASEPESFDRLRKRAASLPKNASVVLYCGCCPWEHCPNIRPAYKDMQKMGFKSIKALYLETSFGTDWVDKGYPVEKGEAR